MEKEQIQEELRNAINSDAPINNLLTGGRSEKRVGVYLRVASQEDNAVSTAEMLTQHYRNFIDSQTGWTLYRFYIDEGLAYRKAKDFAFSEMMENARNHKIDLVITRNLSRFSRNVSSAIETIRELAGLEPPVGVFIEVENLYSLSAGSLFLLDIVQAIAAEESRNKSRVIRFG